MKIAYLMNTYPVTSGTFIRREIRELEKNGLTITRYAIRVWQEKLVEPDDIDEQHRTKYILTNNVLAIIIALIKELFVNPKGFKQALGLWFKLIRNAKGLIVHHFAYLLQAAFLRQQADRDGIDHIHAHFCTNATTVAMLVSKLGGPTFSFTAHGPDEFDAPVHTSIAIKVAEAAFVVAISHFCKSQLVRYSSFEHWEKIKIFHCGVSIDEYKVSDTLFTDNYQLVCVGRLSSLKGQLLLPEIIAELRDEFPQIKLVLIGDGECREALQEKIHSLDLQGSVELLGWQANQRVREIVGNSRLLLLPSFAEGLPIVFMEALALGRPVLATYIAGIPELVDEQCGWIVPAGSQPDLLASLRAALRTADDVLITKGAVGRKRIEDSYTLDQLARSLSKAFAETTASSRSS